VSRTGSKAKSLSGSDRRRRRLAVERRDGNLCGFCSARDDALGLTRVLPLALGGTNEIANLKLACEPCRLARGDRTHRLLPPERRDPRNFPLAAS
jgi:5-methylcytosine-specific restriction endonuclease McrA